MNRGVERSSKIAKESKERRRRRRRIGGAIAGYWSNLDVLLGVPEKELKKLRERRQCLNCCRKKPKEFLQSIAHGDGKHTKPREHQKQNTSDVE